MTKVVSKVEKPFDLYQEVFGVPAPEEPQVLLRVIQELTEFQKVTPCSTLKCDNTGATLVIDGECEILEIIGSENMRKSTCVPAYQAILKSYSPHEIIAGDLSPTIAKAVQSLKEHKQG